MEDCENRSHEDRIRALEGWRNTSEAVAAVQRAADLAAQERLEVRLDKIEDMIKRLVWLVIAALIGGILNFIIQGGLVNVAN